MCISRLTKRFFYYIIVLFKTIRNKIIFKWTDCLRGGMFMDRQKLYRQVMEFCSYRRVISNLYADFAKEVGLTYTTMFVLYLIYTEGETCTQKIICEKSLLPKQTVNSIITSFLKQKIINLSEMQDDRRTKFIRFTNSGKKFVDNFIPKIVAAEIDAMGKLDDEQRGAFIDSTKLYGEYFCDCLKKAKKTLRK